MERVTVAVTNYNGERYLPACLAAIKALDYADFEIMVVDSASTDGSIPYLQKHHPDVRILSLKENRGPGPARNAALHAAANRIVYSVDNDAVVDPSSLRLLVSALREEPDAAVAEPRSLFHQKKDTIQYDGGLCNYIGLMHLRNYHARVGDAACEKVFVDSAVSVALVMDRDRVAKAGAYDDAFFFYFEDFDLSLRLRLMGWKIVHVPKALVFHREGTPGLSFREGDYTPRKAFFHSRNRWMCLLKSYSLKNLILTFPAHLIYEVMWMAFLLPRGLFLENVRGKASLVRQLPELWKKRRAFQKRRVRPDREILGYYGLTVAPSVRGRGLGLRMMDRIFSLYWKLIRPLV